jgi:hypothetical protein
LCDYLIEKDEIDAIISAESKVYTSLFGVLAGLTFTSCVLVYQIRATLPFGDVFLTITLITAVLFVFAAVTAGRVIGYMRGHEFQEAINTFEIANHFGLVGFIMLLIDIDLIAFSAGWVYGLILIITIIGALLYFQRTGRR